MCIPLLGAVVAGAGAAMQVQQQQKQAKMQAQLYEREARRDKERGAYSAARRTEENARILGDQRATFAGSGVSPSYGSASDVSVDSATEGNLDVAAIRWNSELQAQTNRERASITRASAPSGAAAGLAFISPIIQTAGQMYQSLA